MGLKSLLVKPYARYIVGSNKRWINNPIAAQERVFKSLIDQAKKTLFGKDHCFENIKSYNDFKQNVPIVDYEKLRSYIDLIKKEKQMFYGQVFLFTCQKHLALLREQSIFLSARNQCHFI